MSLLAAILYAVAGPLAEIIDNASSNEYDKHRELQSMLRLSRAISDARVAHFIQLQLQKDK